MHAAGERAFKRIWRIAGIATFSSLWECDTVIQAVCFPSAIKSNRPLISQWSSFRNDSDEWQLPRALHAPITTQIYLSQQGKTACVWLDLDFACIMHSSMCTLARAKERKGTSSTQKVWHLWFAAVGFQLLSCRARPLFPVSCFDRIWPCSGEIRSLALLIIKQYCNYEGLNTHGRAHVDTQPIRKENNWASVKVCGCEVKLRLANAPCSTKRPLNDITSALA